MTQVLVSLHCSCAEQLVLYMKAEECLSSALRTAKESLSQGDLLPSSPVKQGETLFLCAAAGKTVAHCCDWFVRMTKCGVFSLQRCGS